MAGAKQNWYTTNSNIENQLDKANKEVMKGIGEERALMCAHKKGNKLGTP